MISRINTCSIVGKEAHLVLVESDVHNGLPDFRIVGASSMEVKDARDRVRVGVENAGFILPPKRITVSLVPAALKKSGTIFDAAIAVSILSSFGFILSEELEEYLILGEVALDGSLRETEGVLFSVLFGQKMGIKKFIIPVGNLKECSLIDDAVIYGFHNLYDLAVFFNGDASEVLKPPAYQKAEIIFPSFNEIFHEKHTKIAMIAALSGGHGLLFTGGSSDYRKKFFLSLSGILKQEKRDILLKAAYKSIVTLPDITSREIAGIPVYFYKDIKEYKYNHIPISGKNGIIEVYEDWVNDIEEPAFMSFYRCKCKALYQKNCICSPRQQKDRQNIINKLMLEKADIFATTGDDEDIEETRLKEMYDNACVMQNMRFTDRDFKENAAIPDKLTEKYCHLNREAINYFEDFTKSFLCDKKEINRILRLSRTIADMDKNDTIALKHLKYAIKLRGVYD